MAAATTVSLFSYGRLQYKDVQISTFGRELVGRADSLPGYVRTITDIGGVLYFNVQPSSHPEDFVSGILFEITDQELHAADRYAKGIAYHRICVRVGSGVEAWAYCTSG